MKKKIRYAFSMFLYLESLLYKDYSSVEILAITDAIVDKFFYYKEFPFKYTTVDMVGSDTACFRSRKEAYNYAVLCKEGNEMEKDWSNVVFISYTITKKKVKEEQYQY